MCANLMALDLKELEVPVKQMLWGYRSHPAWEERLGYTSVMLMHRSSSALIPCMHAFALNIKMY